MVGLGSEHFCLHFVQFFENGFAFFDGVTWFLERGTDEKICQRHVSFLCAPEEKFSLRRSNAQGDGQVSCSVFFGDHTFVLPKYYCVAVFVSAPGDKNNSIRHLLRCRPLPTGEIPSTSQHLFRDYFHGNEDHIQCRGHKSSSP